MSNFTCPNCFEQSVREADTTDWTNVVPYLSELGIIKLDRIQFLLVCPLCGWYGINSHNADHLPGTYTRVKQLLSTRTDLPAPKTVLNTIDLGNVEDLIRMLFRIRHKMRAQRPARNTAETGHPNPENSA